MIWKYILNTLNYKKKENWNNSTAVKLLISEASVEWSPFGYGWPVFLEHLPYAKQRVSEANTLLSKGYQNVYS